MANTKDNIRLAAKEMHKLSKANALIQVGTGVIMTRFSLDRVGILLAKHVAINLQKEEALSMIRHDLADVPVIREYGTLVVRAKILDGHIRATIYALPGIIQEKLQK